MWWWSHGWWWPGLVLMAAVMVICLVHMVGMMRRMGGMCGFGRRRSGRHRMDAAEQILDERLARGEIDIGEHHRRRDALAGLSNRADGKGDDQR